jgi:hypothetical protein
MMKEWAATAPPPMAELYAKIIALFSEPRLTSPFVTTTRRIRAFSAPVPKPNNAVDESKEKASSWKEKLVACMRACRGFVLLNSPLLHIICWAETLSDYAMHIA